MLLPFTIEFKFRFVFCLFCLVLIQAANLSVPALIGSIVDALNNSGGVPDAAVFAAIPLGLLLCYVFVRFSTLAFAELQNAVFGTITVRATRRLSLKLLAHLHALDVDYHLSRKTGGLTRDMDRGIMALTSLLRLFTFTLTSMLISIIGVMGIFLQWFGSIYAVIVGVAATLYAIYTVKVTAWRTPIIRESNDAHSRAHTRAVDSLINYENVKIFGTESLEHELYDSELIHWEKARARNRYSLAALNIGQGFVVHAGLFGMLFLACFDLIQGELTTGNFVTISGYATMVFNPLGALGSIYRQLKQAFTDVERMLDMLDVKPTITNPEVKLRLPEGDGPIEFRDVKFHYREDRPILKGVSFRVNPGEKVALVGPSGSGKSTIAKLLFRFYDVTSGAIRVNGVDVREVNVDSLRYAMGMVPQDTTLFNDTLFQNIKYGRVSASDVEVRRAAQMAQLLDTVSNLPEGFETMVGERGLKLSGGEKQRVAIARTMLKRPSFLVFDEATSSLDPETESSVMHAINSVSQHHTTLVIAHRLSTVMDADRIIVLVNGKIQESGTHEQLLLRHGVYHRLWSLQNRELEEERQPQELIQVGGS